MVVVADLNAPHAREKLFCPIRAGAVERVGFLMLDAAHLEAGMQIVPAGRLVGVDDSTLGDASANERQSLSLGAEHGRDRVAAALANDDDGLALARPIAGKTAVATVLAEIGWPDITLPSPPTTRPFISAPIASRTLWSKTKADL
jgi:hypothetical protein